MNDIRKHSLVGFCPHTHEGSYHKSMQNAAAFGNKPSLERGPERQALAAQ